MMTTTTMMMMTKMMVIKTIVMVVIVMEIKMADAGDDIDEDDVKDNDTDKGLTD